jgi:hypothetical protein
MRDSASHRLRELRPAPREPFHRFWLLALLLLLLGILAGPVSDLTRVHAQKTGPVEERKAPEPPKPDTAPAPAGPSSQPQQAGDPFVQSPMSGGRPGPQRFSFKIDPKTPLKDLLPPAPKVEHRSEPVRGNDLSRVPEVQFEAAQSHADGRAIERIAHQIAKINHLNDKVTDGFIEALRIERTDLTGLPFAMGDACRTKGERSKQFAFAVGTVRQAMQPPGAASVPLQPPATLSSTAPPPLPPATQATGPSSGPLPAAPSTPPPAAPTTVPVGNVPVGNTTPIVLGDMSFTRVAFAPAQASVDPPPPETFWEQYQTLCSQQDKAQTQAHCEQRELITLTRIAALTQILLPMTQMHPGFVKYLSTVAHVEATRALARLAIFSAYEDARKAAVEALKVRRERDYTEILVNGLNYPWPSVARRAADAIVKLERNDLLPQLIDVLEQLDPRTPATREVKGKSVPVVSELVRVNHHRSCLLCHAPGNTGKVSADAITAEVPVPGQPLNPPSGPYSNSQPDILVRVDVTYLRQDFSAFLPVADANPWPEMQRFDYLVRTRVLSDEEAASYSEKLKPHEPGEFSPYQRAALAALRELTGRDTEPTPQAWRRLLKLPAQTQRKTS